MKDLPPEALEQVAAYRGSLQAMTREARIGAQAKEVLAAVDGLMARSARQAAASELKDALALATEANRLSIEAITKLRSGETVTISLEFATPADEYAYEQKRFDSGEAMVGMMVGEGRAEGDTRSRVDQFLGEGRKLKRQAESEARAGRHQEAVKLMEGAYQQLNRALQTMGVPAF